MNFWVLGVVIILAWVVYMAFLLGVIDFIYRRYKRRKWEKENGWNSIK
jgi:hypothetical protein